MFCCEGHPNVWFRIIILTFITTFLLGPACGPLPAWLGAGLIITRLKSIEFENLLGATTTTLVFSTVSLFCLFPPRGCIRDIFNFLIFNFIFIFQCPTFGALPQSIVVKVRIYSYDGGNADDGSSCMPAKSLLAGAKASGGGAKAVKSGSVSQDEPPRELVQTWCQELSLSLGVEKEYVAQVFDLYQPRSLDTLEACTLGAASLSRR